ncbi:acyltransferase family protein [Hydrogenophaga sp. RWCD_12]|uniref:acyltransferase family protein n=1 Tax=Hydrogenophaga sp. RWCD_12 TaxID=3391190 RepID=UPI0039854046
MTSPTHDQKSAAYQAHIDGLRAIAVLAVIANHFSPSWLPSGFLGVDVFFVISGFVITASLLSRPRDAFGGFLLSFFQRRIQRLLPALLACVLVTAVCICVLNPQPRSSLMTGISALFGVANLYLYQQSIDYFATAAQANAFTHTWSLGVEEQFYLLYPSLFWLLAGGRGRRPAWVLPVVVGALSLVSYVAFVNVFASRPAAAYFFSPLRFWELGLGCLLCAGRDSTAVTWMQRAVTHLGALPLLGLIACLWISADQLVLASTVAVLLTGLLLVAPAGLGMKALTWPPLRHVGLISYSLYLWHWSVLLLARWSVGITPANTVWLLVAMFLLAEASYRWVESPLRHRPWRLPVTFGLGASLAGAAALLLLATQHRGLLLPVDPGLVNPPAFLPVKDQAFNPRCVVDGRERRFLADTVELCTFPPRPPAGRTLWAMGDSHAGHLQGLLYRLHDTTGVGVHLIETPNQPYPYKGPVFEPREPILQSVHERARPGDVFVVSRLYFKRETMQLFADLEQWSNALLQLARELDKKQMHLLVIGPPPMFEFVDATVCLRPAFSNSACTQDRERMAQLAGRVHQILESALAHQANAHVFRSFDVLCPPGRERCSPIRESTMLYRDRDHLNTAGAALLAEPLERFLAEQGLPLR